MTDFDLFEADSVEEIFIGIGEYDGGRDEKGERHGEGRAVYFNGDSFQGKFENGKRHGFGIYTFKRTHNASYTGQYSKGKRHGEGVFLYPNGSRYEGNWKNGVRSGKGTYTYTNGDEYKGCWEDNKRHGNGEYTYKDQNMKYKGNWEYGQMSGVGKLITPVYSFIGSFEEGKPTGQGRYTFNVGCTQNGHYYEKRIVTLTGDNRKIVSHVPHWKCHSMNFSVPYE